MNEGAFFSYLSHATKAIVKRYDREMHPLDTWSVRQDLRNPLLMPNAFPGELLSQVDSELPTMVLVNGLLLFSVVSLKDGYLIIGPNLPPGDLPVRKKLTGIPLTEDPQRTLKINAIIPQIKAYAGVLANLQEQACLIPPSGAIAGIYASMDNRAGVWQAPANIGIASVKDLTRYISDGDQEKMNVDTETSKSINAIRYFRGKGILVWGARTLDGGSNEWRYVPVRRLFSYVEQSVKLATSWAVFQPNDTNTWIKIKCQISNFLSTLWRDGALAGASPDQAFFVEVGKGVTMTEDDINNGYLIVRIGLAAVRPAEFIVLQFSHKVNE